MIQGHSWLHRDSRPAEGTWYNHRPGRRGRGGGGRGRGEGKEDGEEECYCKEVSGIESENNPSLSQDVSSGWVLPFTLFFPRLLSSPTEQFSLLITAWRLLTSLLGSICRCPQIPVFCAHNIQKLNSKNPHTIHCLCFVLNAMPSRRGWHWAEEN